MSATEYRERREINTVKVQPIRVEWVCPNCGLGNMECNGGIEGGYHHTCGTCGIELIVEMRFPHIDYEDIP